MNYTISPFPYRMARHFARMAAMDRMNESCLSLDVLEEDNSYILHALVPGLKADDLNIQVLDDTVTISGEFKDDGSEYLLRELPHGTFRRSIQLPVSLDPAKAEAKISNGLLTLRLVKAESAQPKTIKVAVK
jgi:HSP20 family protein